MVVVVFECMYMTGVLCVCVCEFQWDDDDDDVLGERRGDCASACVYKKDTER